MPYGAIFYGISERFNFHNMKCRDWMIDKQFIEDFGLAGKEYLVEIERNGPACGHCLWNDGESCLHPKVSESNNEK